MGRGPARSPLFHMVTASILLIILESEPQEELRRRLQARGHSVVGTVDNGREGICRAAELNPDVVVMNIHLSGLPDGVDTGIRLREQFGIPVIYVTKDSKEETIARARVAEPYGYLLRPLKDRELSVAIELALFRRRMEKERRRLAAELEASRTEISQLKGLLPVCSRCKMIRDSEGTWFRMEEYIQQRSDATFSHGFCPGCFDRERQNIQTEFRVLKADRTSRVGAQAG